MRAKFVNENSVSVEDVRKGQILFATDSYYQDQDKNRIKVLSIDKDISGEYDVEVEFLDGDMKGKTDEWYLNVDDKVFFDINEDLKDILKPGSHEDIWKNLKNIFWHLHNVETTELHHNYPVSDDQPHVVYYGQSNGSFFYFNLFLDNVTKLWRIVIDTPSGKILCSRSSHSLDEMFGLLLNIVGSNAQVRDPHLNKFIRAKWYDKYKK